MKGITAKQNKLSRRHAKIRARVSGTAERPRMAVYKSNRFLEVQLIDDVAGKTLVAGNTKEYVGKEKGTKTDAAVQLGAAIAQRAKAKGIEAVVFDRGGFRYTGRIAAFADAARNQGMKF